MRVIISLDDVYHLKLFRCSEKTLLTKNDAGTGELLPLRTDDQNNLLCYNRSLLRVRLLLP